MNAQSYKFACKCGHSWEKVCNHHQAVDQACPACKSEAGVSIDRTELRDGVASGRQYVGRKWGEQERVWLEGPTIKHSDLPKWRRDVPGMELNDKGKVVFHSDAHQRSVFKAMKEGGAYYAAKSQAQESGQ